MKVKDLMKTRNLVSVRPEDELTIAAQIMRWAGVRHLPVLEEGKVVGVLTERDLLRHRAEAGQRGERDLVRAFMTSPPEVVGPEEDLAAACALMVARRIGCLPVVDDAGALVGIVTTTDIVGRQVASYMESTAAGGPVAGLATRREVPRVAPYAPLLEAVGLMVDRGVRHVAVVDENERVVGIVSDRDVRTAIGDPGEALRRGEELSELEAIRVDSVMTTDPVTVGDQASLQEVAQLFVDERVGAIPVIDAHHRVVGIVSYVDVIRGLLASWRDRGAAAPGASRRGGGRDRAAPP